jgi:ribosomal-protein-alanine N-acetyltransferase
MWISTHARAWEVRRALHWAACKAGSDRIVGYAGLNRIDTGHHEAELRFWVGSGVERNRDAVEWSSAILQFAMAALDMNRVYALQLCRHLLVGRVLAAIGMQTEGLLRKRIIKDGRVEDTICWVILRRDWSAKRARRNA